MRSRRAQIKMMETVVVILFFIVIMVGAFFYFIQSKVDSYEKGAARQEIKETISRVAVVTGLPEIACSSAGDVLSTCIDKSKLAFFNPSSDTGFYYDYLGLTDIIIEQIYPTLTTTVSHDALPASFFDTQKGYLCDASEPRPTGPVADGNLHYGEDAKSYGQCEKWIVYRNRPDTFQNSVPYYLPVSLYDPLDESYSLGVMTVWTYT